ncbi:MAG: NUDIX domain-containing protein [Bilifractor sp.]
MEYIDIYDVNRRKTGRVVPRKEYKLQPGEYMLVVIAMLETPDHRFLITQRKWDKKWAAGDWEISGGGVRAGETSLEAVRREVREETGLDVSGAEGGCVYTYQNTDPDGGDNYFTDIYHFHMPFSDKNVKLQEEETEDFRIVSFPEIRKIGESGHFLHYKRILQALHAEGVQV